MSINDQFDMSVFDGTIYEGLTYLQVRRRMTPEQLRRWKMINKRQRKLARTKAAEAEHAKTYIKGKAIRGR